MKRWDSIKDRPWNAHAGGSSIVALCETCRLHMRVYAIINAEAPVCGSLEPDSKPFHHFHLDWWTNNTRYSAKSLPVERKPEMGAFTCCQCPLTLNIEFWAPLVPEYLLSTFKKRKTSNNSALNIINRNKDSKPTLPTNSYATLATYVCHVLNQRARPINTSPDTPFARRLGADADVFRFIEFLGWVREEDQMLHPPQWDEEFEKGRLRRKLLESAELELTQLSIDSGKDIAQSDKVGMSVY